MTSQPNPGSPEAVKLGCICPVIGNQHGKGIGTGGTFWTDGKCPLHNRDERLKGGPGMKAIILSLLCGALAGFLSSRFLWAQASLGQP